MEGGKRQGGDPEQIDEPMCDCEKDEGVKAELRCAGGESQADGRPPDKEIRI